MNDDTVLKIYESLRTSFEEIILKHPDLQELSIANNFLTHIPKTIESLKHLRILNLINNQIDSIPDEVASLTQLIELDLSHNNLTEFPKAVTKIPHLRSLSLTDNPFEEISEEIQNLTKLEKLTVSPTQFRNMPKKIAGKTVSLSSGSERRDDLVYVQIITSENIPIESKLQNFNGHTLHFSNYALSNIPPEVFQFNNLSMLNLMANNLSEIDNRIGNLMNLEILVLTANQLEDLPDSFKKLKKLKLLSLGLNPFTELPHIISELDNLEFLDISFSLLKNPENVIENVKNLKKISYLNVSNNPFDSKFSKSHLDLLPSLEILSINPEHITEEAKLSLQAKGVQIQHPVKTHSPDSLKRRLLAR